MQHGAARQKGHAVIRISNVVPHELRSIEDAAVVSVRKVQKLLMGQALNRHFGLHCARQVRAHSRGAGPPPRSRRSEPASTCFSFMVPRCPPSTKARYRAATTGSSSSTWRPLAADDAGLDPPADTNPLDDLVLKDQLLPIRRALEQQLAAGVDARAPHGGHEDPVVGMRGRAPARRRSGAAARADSATPGVQAIVLEGHLEGVHRQVDAGQHFAVPQNPPADVLVLPDYPAVRPGARSRCVRRRASPSATHVRGTRPPAARPRGLTLPEFTKWPSSVRVQTLPRS